MPTDHVRETQASGSCGNVVSTLPAEQGFAWDRPSAPIQFAPLPTFELSVICGTRSTECLSDVHAKIASWPFTYGGTNRRHRAYRHRGILGGRATLRPLLCRPRPTRLLHWQDGNWKVDAAPEPDTSGPVRGPWGRAD